MVQKFKKVQKFKTVKSSLPKRSPVSHTIKIASKKAKKSHKFAIKHGFFWQRILTQKSPKELNLRVMT
jgi:hypothetical protein